MTVNKRAPNLIDSHVGLKLRSIRRHREITQAHLGRLANISFQQVQKYEKGMNRISVSRLWKFCELLNVTPEYFFEGLSKPSIADSMLTSAFTHGRAYEAFDAMK